MTIRFVGIDPETDEDGCPTVWVDAEAGDLLVQSYTADEATTAECDSASPARSPKPQEETVIRIPQRMIPALRRACDELDSGVR
ncbi:hypothetical protein [Streptomyces synnematoformans]|uniref:Uncharacterized protein n=1 Tax=Streptomyces synnematoformans TaxID=415721 RepID=A0ABN2YYM4_9ACTN